MTRELLILRHAKSAWDTDAPSDFQRPLAKRGHRDAPNMGRWIDEAGLRPGYVLSSPAMRAWQTAVTVCHEFGIPEEEINFDSRLYLGSCESLLAVLRETPSEAERVLLVGHNPGLEVLLRYLVGDAALEGEDDKLLPTAALAQIELSEEWQHLAQHCGRLITLTRPREI